jgi:hypothetical protein
VSGFNVPGTGTDRNLSGVNVCSGTGFSVPGDAADRNLSGVADRNLSGVADRNLSGVTDRKVSGLAMPLGCSAIGSNMSGLNVSGKTSLGPGAVAARI